MKKKLLTAGVFLAVFVYLLITANGNSSDFDIYTQGAMAVFSGKDAYSITFIDGYHYYYSLLFAIFIYPLSYLPVPIAKFTWLALNAFFLYRIIKIIKEYFDVTGFSAREKLFFYSVCLAFGLEFILLNFRYQQVTICILYLSLEGLRLIFSGKKFAGALLIALGINIKVLPIVLLPYLLYRKEFKAAIWIVVSYCALMALPAFILGFHRNNELLASWWHLVNPMNKDHVLDVDERSFHSLSTLLATLLVAKVPDAHALPIKRNIANITPAQLTYVLNGVRLVLVSFSFYFFRTKPFTSAKGVLHQYWEVSYLLLLIPLIFPHQQVYAFLFVAPAACYILYYLMTQRNNISIVRSRILVTGFILSYLVCNINLLLGQYKQYYEHFKVLTYGALLLIPMLASCVPVGLRKIKKVSVQNHVA